MRRWALVIAGVLVSVVLAAGAWVRGNDHRSALARTGVPGRGASVHRVNGGLLAFEPNVGQVGPGVMFLGRGPGASVAAGRSGFVLQVVRQQRGQQAREQSIVGIRFLRPSSMVSVLPGPRAGGVSNYLMGGDPSKWRLGMPRYRSLVYQGVYRGIDAVLRGGGGGVRYDFAVHPGVDPSLIGFAVQDARSLALSQDGALMIRVRNGRLFQPRPRVYQNVGGQRVTIPAAYTLGGDERVGFALGRYDRSRTLFIDPDLDYSTYLGGTGDDFPIWMDRRSGAVYTTGQSSSVDFPTTPGSVSPGFRGGATDAFVTKYSRTGAVVYSTYLGGGGADAAIGIFVDRFGQAYVTGQTNSRNFPTTRHAFQRTYNGGSADAFAVKLNRAGSGLVYSTYLGGGGMDAGFINPIDARGSVYIEGSSSSRDFPTTKHSFQRHYGGGPADAFVAKLNRTGSNVLFSTYVGGAGEDVGMDGVQRNGNAFMTGHTTSSDFPTTQHAFQRAFGGGDPNGSNSDAFVLELSGDGSGLAYSTYLGGSGDEIPFDLTVDRRGNTYVPGLTTSSNFPTTRHALQRSLNGSSDGFVAGLTPAGSQLVFSTYLGGSGDDIAGGVRVDGGGGAYVPGTTSSADFPITQNAFQRTFGGGPEDAFVVRLNDRGSRLVYSTYLGGSADDGTVGEGERIAPNGHLIFAGFTSSADFPTTPNAAQRRLAGGYDGFLVNADVPAAHRRQALGAAPLAHPATTPTRPAAQLPFFTRLRLASQW